MVNEQRLSPAMLEALSALIADRLGLHFPSERQGELVQAVSLLAAKLGHADATACAHGLIQSTLTPEQIELLAGCLTVGETYFFRESNVFSRLDNEILPALIKERRNNDRRIRVWSTACSTGEEPYSIAILLDRLLPDRNEWDVTILATDINPAALEHARRGLYREWSFRQTPTWIKQKYFKPQGKGRYEIAAHLKDQVSFKQLNLAADGYPSVLNNICAMDFIFCCNVLMYFTPECTCLTVEKLSRCLNPEGWLIVGQAELPQIQSPNLIPAHFDDAVVYQHKNSSTGLIHLPAAQSLPNFESRLQAKKQYMRDNIPHEIKDLTAGIDWGNVYQRLEKAEAALEECWQPSEERQQHLLKERALRIAKSRGAALSEQTEASFPVIEFRLAEERYAIEAEYVKEVFAPKDLTLVPCTPFFVAGIISIRGQIVSVIDLRKFFGLRVNGLTNLNKVVVLRGLGLELGILADEIIGERNLPCATVISYPGGPLEEGAEWREKYSKGVTSDGLNMLAVEIILADPAIVVREEIEGDFLPGG